MDARLLRVIEDAAMSATAGVVDDGYRLRAPYVDGEQGDVIVEYKGSEHPNAINDGALFGRAREYILVLVDAVLERDARLAAVVDQARRFAKAYEYNAEYCEKRFSEASGEWAQEYARKAATCRGVASDMNEIVRIAEGGSK